VVFTFADERAVPCGALALNFASLVAFRSAKSGKTHVSEKAVAVGVDEDILAFDITVNLRKSEDPNTHHLEEFEGCKRNNREKYGKTSGNRTDRGEDKRLRFVDCIIIYGIQQTASPPAPQSK
jgi:hypothetical protein